MIIVVDFGSQTAHLITRRLSDLGVEIVLVDPDEVIEKVTKDKPEGIIFSGGPASVYETGAPTISRKVLELGIPILGICYGWQLIAKLLGGKVAAGKKEYGPVTLKISDFDDLFYGLPGQLRVFESHGDTVDSAPAGFQELAASGRVKNAAVADRTRRIFGVQFHPEMEHTQEGEAILKNFATRICNLSLVPKKVDVAKMIAEIRQKVGDWQVIGAVSGGTDSTVAGTLVARAIGRQFLPYFVDSGLMREETLGRIKNQLPKFFKMEVKIISAGEKFLQALAGVVDPEAKRKAVGGLYIELFEREMRRQKNIKFLLQGTTYADFIHSQGSRRSAHIKSHHNVGGLPKDMKLKLLEPLRYFYTDQVRELGRELGLPEEVVRQQPFPGPGQAVRIVGEVTRERLQRQIQADAIVVAVLAKAGWYEKVFQCWSVMTGAMSTGIKGDGRFYGEVAAVRVVQSRDRMTADWVRLPAELLARISTRIVNEVPGISRVVYDITSKPPATMEWE